jgi:N-glycosylase/DNA lyase
MPLRFIIGVPEDFDFWLTVGRSGWSVLAPFHLDSENSAISRAQRLSTGRIVYATLTAEEGGIAVSLGRDELDGGEVEELEDIVGTMLNLDEDLSGFHAMIEGHPDLGWAAEMGVGRSIRCPTVFEDVVKTICTTNASWGLTKGITRRLCEKLGEPIGDSHTFPTPGALASTTEEFLRREVKSGYRSPYLMGLARRIVEGEIDPEAWANSPLGTDELKAEIIALKGVGEYAANNILQLLGRYDFLALDSWMRRKFSEIHRGGEPADDAEIEEHYAQFDRWKGLALRLDMAKEFIIKEFG